MVYSRAARRLFDRLGLDFRPSAFFFGGGMIENRGGAARPTSLSQPPPKGQGLGGARVTAGGRVGSGPTREIRIDHKVFNECSCKVVLQEEGIVL